MTAFLVLRDQIRIPLLSGAEKRIDKPKPRRMYEIDVHYENIQSEMQDIFDILTVAA